MLKPKLHALFVEYDEAHRHPTNRLTHVIAIPLIVFHIIAMLSWIPLVTVGGFTITVALVAYLGAIAWYLSLDVRLGLIMAVLFGALFPLAGLVPWQAVVAIAVVGWLVQLAGHVVWEKRSPAFLRNLLQALVGPLFFVAKLTGDWKEGAASQPKMDAAR